MKFNDMVKSMRKSGDIWFFDHGDDTNILWIDGVEYIIVPDDIDGGYNLNMWVDEDEMDYICTIEDGMSMDEIRSMINDANKSTRKSMVEPEDFEVFVDSLDSSYYGMNGRYEIGSVSNPMIYYYSAGLDEIYEIAIAFDTFEVTLSEPDMEMRGWVAIASEPFNSSSDISGIVMRLTGKIEKSMRKSFDWREAGGSLFSEYKGTKCSKDTMYCEYCYDCVYMLYANEYVDDNNNVIAYTCDVFNPVAQMYFGEQEADSMEDAMRMAERRVEHYCGKSVRKKDGLRKSAEWVEEGGMTYTWLTSKMGDLKFIIDTHDKTSDGMVYYEILKLNDDGNYNYFAHGKCNTIEEAQFECERYMNESDNYCDVCNTYLGSDKHSVNIYGEDMNLCTDCFNETAECWFCHEIFFKDDGELNQMADGDDYLCETCYQALRSRGEEVAVLRRSMKKSDIDATDDMICEYLQLNGPSTSEEIASDELISAMGVSDMESRLERLVDMGEITYDNGKYSPIYPVEKSHKMRKGRGIVNLTIDNLLHKDFFELDRYMRDEWNLHCTGYETEMTPSQLNNVVEAIRIYEMDEDLWEHHTENRGNGSQWDAGESISLDIQEDLSFDQSFPNNEVLVYQDRKSWKTIIVQMKFYAYSEDLETDTYSEDAWVTASTRKTKRRMR